MSLILEALRKSEAERRRGQAPGLFTPDAAVLMPGHERRPRWLYAAGAITVLALIATGWWLVSADRTQADATTAAEHAPPDESRPSAGEPPSTVAASVTATAIPAPAPGVATSTSIAMPSTQSAPTATSTPTPSAVAPAITSASMQRSTRQRPAFPDSLAAAPARDPGIASTIPGTNTAATESLPIASQGDEAPAVTLAVLPSSRRSQLPPLKLSMHVYNEDAARRFAIVDGQRITEGSQLGEVTVRTIRRDGVLIELDGERYLLPRP